MPRTYLNITIDTYVVASTREISIASSNSSFHFSLSQSASRRGPHGSRKRQRRAGEEIAPLRVALGQIDDALGQPLDIDHLAGLYLTWIAGIEHPDREVRLADRIDELDVFRCEL